MPGGYRNNNGNFNNQSNNGNWWSSTENDASNAYNRNLNYNNDNLNRNNNNKRYGFSLRLVRDLMGDSQPCGSNPAWCFYWNTIENHEEWKEYKEGKQKKDAPLEEKDEDKRVAQPPTTASQNACRRRNTGTSAVPQTLYAIWAPLRQKSAAKE